MSSASDPVDDAPQPLAPPAPRGGGGTDGDAAAPLDARGLRIRATTPVLLLLLLAAPLFFELTPLDGLILCPIRAATGIECAGCGMTRSWIALTHGDLHTSFAAHPFGLLLFAAVALKALHLTVELRTRRAWTPAFWKRYRLHILVSVAVAFLLLGLIRAARALL